MNDSIRIKEQKTEGRFKVEVQADSTGTWAGNALRFDSIGEGEAYAFDLWSRWTAVQEWRVVDTADGSVVSDSGKKVTLG